MHKVYVVEDSIIVRNRLISLLMGLPGIEVVGFSGTIKDAAAGIQNHKPDMVILDIRLNDGNGIHLLQKIKLEMPSIRVIMLTNYSIPAYENRCRELGADYFFDKSKDFERILDVVSDKSA
jgi:DNA-binding NarL/FixJ family response regulator